MATKRSGRSPLQKAAHSSEAYSVGEMMLDGLFNKIEDLGGSYTADVANTLTFMAAKTPAGRKLVEKLGAAAIARRAKAR